MQQVLTRGDAPSPEIRFANFDLSPQAGRGVELARLPIQLVTLILRRQHVADPAANELPLLLTGAGVETDVVGDDGRAFQHHDAVANLKRF